MELADFVLVLTRLAVGALGTFLAILLWSQTREMAWVLVAIGVLVSYVEILLTTLEMFGILPAEFFYVSGLPALKLVLQNLPTILYSAAFITIIARRPG